MLPKLSLCPRPSLIAALVLTLAALAAARPRAAAAAEDVSGLIEQSKALRMAGDDEAAYKLLVKAYGLSRTPRVAADLAMCEINLARWVDAENHLKEALSTGANDPFIERNRAAITTQLKRVRTHLGHLEVTGRPSGADVEVAGQAVGRLPLPGPLRVPTGEINVRVAAAGYQVQRRDVRIEPGQLHRVTFELEPGAPPATPGAGPVTRLPDTALQAVAPPAGSAPAADWKRPAAWTSVAVAAGLAAVGGWSVYTYNNDIHAFNDYTKAMTSDGLCATRRADKGGTHCKRLMDHANKMKTFAILGFSGAALAAGAATALFLTAPAGERATAPAGYALSCLPSAAPGELGGHCHLSF